MSALTSLSGVARQALGLEPSAPSELDVLPASALKVGGITAFSATDYPGQLAAVVFVQGCPWRCGYCHNPHLQTRTRTSPLDWHEVMARLRRRVGLIDAVVFSGGEPTIDPALAAAMAEVRALGFGVGLHTAGCYPQRLQEVLPLVDWVGFDFKAAPASYDAVTQIPASVQAALTSAACVLASGVAYEFRTTVHPELHSDAGLLSLAQSLHTMGVRHYAVQSFRATGCADAGLNASAAVHAANLPSAEVLAQMTGLFDTFILRRD